MSSKMLHFTDIKRDLPPKHAPEKRIEDFKEIYTGFSPENAEIQASRCSQCGVPFCASGCPLSNDIPDWLFLTASNRLEEAYRLSASTNAFPEICGRICPQDRLCEGACVVKPGFEAVTIGAVERFLTDNAFAQGWVKPEQPFETRRQSIGIIGAGPAGLACAAKLRALGYEVHVYDRHPQAGGLLMYGVPSFKLEKSIVQRRLEVLKTQGVIFHLKTEIGAEAGMLPFQTLRETHDAIFIATGVYTPRPLSAQGASLENIIPALEYLIAAHAPETLSQPASAPPKAAGKEVLIIGGGDTAMDCARTAIRQKAKKVTCLYRRDRESMPGSAQEVRNAEEEGVIFRFLASPEAFLPNPEGNAVAEAVFRAMRLAPARLMDGKRQQIEPLAERFSLKADLVILALGFEPEKLPAKWQIPSLKTAPHGTLSVSPSHQTSLEGVFAGGDIVRGASLAVWAIKDGQDAALEIHHYFERKI